MCTAVSVVCTCHYFGRNLDYEHAFGEKICITPRNYTFKFTNGKTLSNHYAIMGIAVAENGYPLYFDAINEKGLSVAGLNFPGYACYFKETTGKDNVASYEFVTYVLSQCSNIESVKRLLSDINITDTPFSDKLPPSPLHWIIADKTSCIVVEQTENGLKTFDNNVGVLSNSPSFDMQLFNLNNYISLSAKEPENTFSDKINLSLYSRGMGALGLPGDNSSVSRFIRAAFVSLNSDFKGDDKEQVNQFFHILYSVYQQKGCIKVNGMDEITNYSVCYNAAKGICYFTTYNNFSINAVSMNKENLDADSLISYELYRKNKFNTVN